MNFQSHIDSICKKTNQKLNALFRVSSFMSVDKLSLLINSFIRSQFSYCPLIWMFCNRTSMNKINRIQERCLRLVLNDYTTESGDQRVTYNLRSYNIFPCDIPRSNRYGLSSISYRANQYGIYFQILLKILLLLVYSNLE